MAFTPSASLDSYAEVPRAALVVRDNQTSMRPIAGGSSTPSEATHRKVDPGQSELKFWPPDDAAPSAEFLAAVDQTRADLRRLDDGTPHVPRALREDEAELILRGSRSRRSAD